MRGEYDLKKFVKMMILVAAAICALCVGVGAEEISGSCGSNGAGSGVTDEVAWTLDTESGVLTISGSGETEQDEAMLAYSGAIRKVVMEEGITAIGDYMFFADFPALEEVTLPQSLEWIGSCAFKGCRSLTEIVIPENCTRIVSGAFSGTGLTSVTFACQEVSLGESVFSSTKLTRVQLPGGTIGKAAFRNCAELTAIAMPANTTIASDNAFEGCTALTQIFYGGSSADWKKTLSNTTANSPLKTVTICYTTGTLPETLGYTVSNIRVEGNDLVWDGPESGSSTVSRVYAAGNDLWGDGVDNRMDLRGKSGTLDRIDLYWKSYVVDQARPAQPITVTCVTETKAEAMPVIFVPTETAGTYRAYVQGAAGQRVALSTYSGGWISDENSFLITSSNISTEKYRVSTFSDLVSDGNGNYTCTITTWGNFESCTVGEAPAASVTVAVPGGAEATLGGQTLSGESVRFEGVAAGTYDVTVKRDGCLTYTIKNITVGEADVDLGEITLVAGDVNEDDKINIADMGVFRAEFGKTGSAIGNAFTDVNGDGKVNIQDMGTFRQNFGKTAEKDCTVEYTV